MQGDGNSTRVVDYGRRQLIGMLALAGIGTMMGLGSCFRHSGRARGIALWHIWPAEEGQPIYDLLQNFCRKYPDLNLQSQAVSTNNLKAKLLGAAKTNSLPEVFAVNSAWVVDPALRGKVANLSPILQRQGLDPKFLYRDWDFERCVQQGEMHCLPAYSAHGTSMLFINGEILGQIGVKQAPRIENWNAFCDLSREYVRRANPDGELEVLALDPFMGPGMVIHSSLSAGIGAPTISQDGRRSLLGTPASIRVAKALDDFVSSVYGYFGGYRALLEWRFRFAGLHRQPAFSSLPYDKQIFALAAAGSLARYRRFLPMKSLTVQPVPGLDRLHGGLACHTWSYAMSVEAQENPDAWKLLKYLTCEEDGVGRFSRLYGRPSPLRNSVDGPYYQDWGRVWDGVKEAASMDIAYPASAEDEFLRYHMYLVPMRRLRGESIESIMMDIDSQYQAYLDSSVA